LVNGVGFAAGKVGQGFSFNSSNQQQVTIANPDNFDFLTWSYAFWFKSSQPPYPNLIGRQFADTTGWTVHFTSNGQFAIRIDTDAVVNQVRSLPGAADDGQWHFGVVTLNDATKTVQLSLDGAAPSSFNYSGNFNPSGGFFDLGGPTVGAGSYTG